MEMERKTLVGATLKELDDAGAGVAVFATLNVVDKDGDVTLRGAFGKQTAIMLPAHDWMAVPLGKAQISERADEVIADFQMNLDIPLAKDWHSALKFDLEHGEAKQEWSYGFKINDASFGDFDDQEVRFLNSVEVHEISPVVVGAGVGTRTLAVKNGGKMTLQEQLVAAIKTVSSALERCDEVKSLRIADGRDLSPERYKELVSLKTCFHEFGEISENLNVLIGEIEKGGADADDIQKAWDRYEITKIQLQHLT